MDQAVPRLRDDLEGGIGQEEHSPHSQHVMSAHVSQLREETIGATRGSLEDQTEMTDGDWRGGGDLAAGGAAKDEGDLYWVVTNLIDDLPVAAKEGELSNASAEMLTRGAVEGGTVTTTAAAQLSQWRGMAEGTQNKIQVLTTETWVKDQNNPSGEEVGEDDGTINPTMENCVDNGTTMDVRRLPNTAVDQKVLIGSQMEDVLVDPASMASERGSMTVGGLEEEAKVLSVPTEDVTWSQATPEDAIILHASQSQQDGESSKEAEKPREKVRQHLCTKTKEDQAETKTDYPRDVIIIPNQVFVIVRHKDRLTRMS